MPNTDPVYLTHVATCAVRMRTRYNCLFFWDTSLQQSYRDANDGADILVEPHDVMFALHGFCLTLLQLCQCYWYDGKLQVPSRLTQVTSLCILLIPLGWYIKVAPTLPLDMVYFMSYEKMFITVVKYAPQAYFNYRRRSTDGWSIGNILLDLTGGIVSTAQEVLDGVATGDLSNVLGNPVKLGLGLVSIVYDLFFCAQHYLWYPHPKEALKKEEAENRPVDEDEPC